MSLKTVVLLVVVLSVAGPLTAAALPVPWTDDEWFIRTRTSETVGAGVARSAFGASATQDGDVKDLTAQLAVAKASGAAQSRADMDSNAEGIVEFSRGFTLDGAPHRWLVTLFGTLAGTMSVRTADPTVTAGAFITAIARVLDKDGNVLFEIGDAAWDDALIRSPINQGPDNKALLVSLDDSMVLPDGNYSVYGRIQALAGAGQGAPGIADASSLFFNSLVVGGSVLPVRAPSSLSLCVIGLAALIGIRRTRAYFTNPTARHCRRRLDFSAGKRVTNS